MKIFLRTWLVGMLLLPQLLLARQLPIGAAAPDFHLPATDGKNYSLSSFSTASILAVVFTCNHCPTAQAYEGRIKKLTSDYAAKGVQVVAIMPNNAEALRYDELGYTDLGDSFEDMQQRAKDKQFNFPYLYDGDSEVVSRAYGPIATPHIFIFDKSRKLRYQGRIDDMENPAKKPGSTDARNAIEALLQQREVPVAITKVFGCSVKWKEKSKVAHTRTKEPVNVDTLSVGGIKDLLKNNSSNLRLINIWATWCVPCVAEFPEFIILGQTFSQRDFEFVSISADDPERKDKVLQFLDKQHATGKNYLFSGTDKYQLMEAVDPKWQGALPYTVLVEPGGKIVYAQQGEIDPVALRSLIFHHPMIGPLYRE
ncbi:redoxin family protein [Chitinophaga arvensicola]|uniref:Peroxiredoxin n=1 Tax=Chitinophaga arvensicola TaxID=29529 RepID=A0A1I0RD65_9BACT|nr:redoxin family protein [Chitinophaga arvensicola]SEW38784.1 Peroxiredoxin [Chitinophaga arvensicola]